MSVVEELKVMEELQDLLDQVLKLIVQIFILEAVVIKTVRVVFLKVVEEAVVPLH